MLLVLLSAIGLYAAFVWLYENLRAPLRLLLLGIKELVFRQTLTTRYGSWAVVTGASDGIGKGYAQYLARKGMSVVLVARNEAKLAKVANELKAKHGVEVKILVVDFSHGPDIYERLEKELLAVDVGILVNNVGVTHKTPMPLCEVPRQELWDLINVNVAAATLLCRIVAPAMKKRGRGLIVNVSSLTAVCPAPYVTAYGATKAYLTNFSVALREEMKPHNVEVQTVQPGFVHTNMTKLVVDGLDKVYHKYLIGVEEYMAYAGFTIGKTDKTSGHWTHGLQIAGLSMLPEFIRIYMIGRTSQMFGKLASTQLQQGGRTLG